MKMSEELEIKKGSQIRLNDSAIDDISKKMAEKAGISIDKARTELGMGIILGMMMNRHRMQEIKDEEYNKNR